MSLAAALASGFLETSRCPGAFTLDVRSGIDRTHRIGQTRRVFAYRLIARDTVEERVIELQQHKRQLADAIPRANAGVLRRLRREDLELLLS